MMTLNIAVKGNQATSIPALLFATLVNDTQKASIDINFEDGVALTESKEKESLQLVMENGTSVHEGEPIVRKLIELYPSLRTVHEELVSEQSPG